MNDDTLTVEDRPINFGDAHATLSLVPDADDAMWLSDDDLPRLQGWSVLLHPWTPPKQTKAGLFLPDSVMDANEVLTNVFQVRALGPLAFTHPRLRGGSRSGKRREVEAPDSAGNAVLHWEESEAVDFADGVEPPAVGDWVIVRRYSGLSLEKDGIPCKLANDDDILAVINSPKGWKAYIAT